jgi:hypothetical protein
MQTAPERIATFFGSCSVLCVISLVTSGCGQPDPPSACAQQPLVRPCGGELVGTWKLSCYEALGAGVTVTGLPLETYAFDAQGRYALSVADSSYVVNVPSAAFTQDGPYGASCADLSMAAETVGGSCAMDGTTCACTHPSAMAGTGTYSVDTGTSVTLSQAVVAPYCVDGDVLSLPVVIGNFATLGMFAKQ